MLAIVLLLSLAASPSLPVWMRAAGDYASSAPVLVPEKRVRLQPLRRKLSNDIQYQRSATFEGVPLAKIIADFGPIPKGIDLALLHFSNEMLVPLPLAELDKLDAFVALGICEQGKCSTDFAPVEKGDDFYVDRRPIRFPSNKLVVANAKGFSPFRHTASLIGIELANARAYDHQFDVSSAPKVQAGLVLFRQRCQFCPGVRGVGASFGWDYVKPVALYEYRSPKSLAMHLRFREGDAAQKGLMMPAFPELDDAAVDGLWAMLEAFAKTPLNSYAP